MRSSASVYFLAAYLSAVALAPAQAQLSPAPQAPAAPAAPAAQPPAPATPDASGAAPAQTPTAQPAAAAVPPGVGPDGPASVAGAPGGTAGADAPTPQSTSHAEGAAPAPNAAGGNAPSPVASDQAGPGAAGSAAAAAVPVPPSHDSERPPAEPVPEQTEYTGFSARLAFGVGGALWFADGDTKLSRPFFFVLDLGYALTRNLTLIARGSSWLPNEDLANEFVGAGAVYRFLAERLYVAAALGLSLTRFGAVSEWSHYVQGLALEADVGQVFPLTTHTSFSVGAHFQFGTPLLGKEPDAFTSLHAGIFVAFGLR